MSEPVYRYPPRSHAFSCRCRRCAPFYRQRSGDGLLRLDLGCLGVLLVCGAVSGVVGWVSADHAAILRALPVAGTVAALAAITVVAVVYLNRREARRLPAGPVLPGSWPAPAAGLSPEDELLALSLELAAARPACNHVTAVPVTAARDDLGILAWWCPRCETQLPAGWRPGR
jgi:hypothetical protein